MLRLDSDHVNWVLVVILVALALLLALVQSTGHERAQPTASPAAIRVDPVAVRLEVRQAETPASGHSERSEEFLAASRSLPSPKMTGLQESFQDGKEVRAPSELWYIAREMYLHGQAADSRELFERVAAVYPDDPAATTWAGIAARRVGDHAGAVRHWEAACAETRFLRETGFLVGADESAKSVLGVWPAVALATEYLESGRVDLAARMIVPLDQGDQGQGPANHPVVSFYAAMVYEQLAMAAPAYRDAVEESLGEKFSPALASSDPGMLVSPNSKSWLTYLTRRALERAIRGARTLDWAALVVPEFATVEPSLAPTVEELLECLGSADFASQAHRKLRALELYESPTDRKIEIFDDLDLLWRNRFVA